MIDFLVCGWLPNTKNKAGAISSGIGIQPSTSKKISYTFI